jgi:hypothetical protein
MGLRNVFSLFSYGVKTIIEIIKLLKIKRVATISLIICTCVVFIDNMINLLFYLKSVFLAALVMKFQRGKDMKVSGRSPFLCKAVPKYLPTGVK